MRLLAYSCNVQMRKSKSTPPFSLLLLQHQPGPTTRSQPSVLPFNIYVETNLRWVALNHYRKRAALQAKTKSLLNRKDVKYERNYDAKVHFKQEFVHNQWLYFDKLPLIQKAHNANKMKEVSYRKQQPQKTGPFQNLNVQTHKVDLDKEGVPITVSIL